MSITLDWIINPIVLMLAGIFGVILGLFFARVQLLKARAKIRNLEIDLLNSNRETLEAQRAYVELESRLQDPAIPVIPMKITGKENSKEKATK
jgi:hypothetical protein